MYQSYKKQERKPCCRKETARCRSCPFGLNFGNNIRYKFKPSFESQASELETYRRKVIQGHSRALESVERR